MAENPNNFQRGPNFVSSYSNNVRFESSTLDCKLVFGELDQFAVPVAVRQHTAMTMAWAEAKITAYYLSINIAVHEAEHGKIPIPVAMIPEAFTLSEELAATPVGKAALERTKQIRDDFLANL